MSEHWNQPVDVGDGTCPKCRTKTGESPAVPRTVRDVLDRIDARKCCRKVPAYVAAVRRTYTYLVETQGASAADVGAWSGGSDASDRVERALKTWHADHDAQAMDARVEEEGRNLDWPSLDGSSIRAFLKATKKRPSAARIAEAAKALLEEAYEASVEGCRGGDPLTWPTTRVQRSVEKELASRSRTKTSPPTPIAFAISSTLVVVATLDPVVVALFDENGKEVR